MVLLSQFEFDSVNKFYIAIMGVWIDLFEAKNVIFGQCQSDCQYLRAQALS